MGIIAVRISSGVVVVIASSGAISSVVIAVAMLLWILWCRMDEKG